MYNLDWIKSILIKQLKCFIYKIIDKDVLIWDKHFSKKLLLCRAGSKFRYLGVNFHKSGHVGYYQN